MGNLMDDYGYCRYCHQSRIIKGVPVGATQDEKNQIASDECDCAGAVREQNILKMIKQGTKHTEKIIAPRSQDAAGAIRSVIEAIARGDLDSISIDIRPGLRVSAKAGKNYKMIVAVKEIVEESSEDYPEDL